MKVFLQLVTVYLATCVVVSSSRPARRCSYLPTEGCTCYTRFGRLTISCVDLSLTALPDLSVIPAGREVILDLSDNRIQSVPSDAFDDIHLIKLIIKNNAHEMGVRFGDAVFESQAETLTHLDLSNSSISYMPHAILKARHLEILSLADNHFVSMPNYFSDLSRLQRLYLHGNKLVVIPRGTFSSLTSLRVLSVTFVLDEQDPTESFLRCGELSGLTTLIIQDTDIKEHLEDLVHPDCLPNIESITCESCELDEDDIEFVTRETASNFRSISLPRNKLRNYSFRTLVTHPLPNLRHLDMSHNLLKAAHLPDVSIMLPSLTSLDLSNNQISVVSSDWFALPSLATFDLSGNKMEGLEQFDWESNHMKVSLVGNTLACDCDWAWLINMVKSQIGGAPGPLDMHEIHNLKCKPSNSAVLVPIKSLGCPSTV